MVSRRSVPPGDGRPLSRRELVRLTLGAWWAALWRALGWAGALFFGIVALIVVVTGAAESEGTFLDALAAWFATWLIEPVRTWPNPAEDNIRILGYLIVGGAIQSGLVGLLIGLPVQRVAEAKYGKPQTQPYRSWAWLLGLAMVLLPALGNLGDLPYSINLNAVKFLPFLLCMANAAGAMYHGPASRHRFRRSAE